jgi:hypothetical protein
MMIPGYIVRRFDRCSSCPHKRGDMSRAVCAKTAHQPILTMIAEPAAGCGDGRWAPKPSETRVAVTVDRAGKLTTGRHTPPRRGCGGCRGH